MDDYRSLTTQVTYVILNRSLVTMSCRNTCFTWNNYDDPVRIANKLQAWKVCSYGVFGLEWGEEEGTPHLQGYLEFSSPVKFTTLNKMLEQNHNVPRYGTAKDASNYCKKGEQPKAEWKALKEKGPNWGLNAIVTEWGEMTEQGNRTDLSAAAEMIKSGKRMRDVAEELPVQYVKFHKGLRALKCELVEPRNEKPECICFWGPSEHGKSQAAREYFAEPQLAYKWHPQCEKWFDGYEGQKEVLFEEFRGQLPLSYILSLTDRYDSKVQFKGGVCEFAATNIVFTSPKHPREWYPECDTQTEELHQLLRRFTKIIDIREYKAMKNVFDTQWPKQ